MAQRIVYTCDLCKKDAVNSLPITIPVPTRKGGEPEYRHVDFCAACSTRVLNWFFEQHGPDEGAAWLKKSGIL